MPEANSIDNFLKRNRQVGVCQMLHLTEENIRFVLLAIILYIYLCCGAFIFQAFEEEAEKEMRESYTSLYNDFTYNLSLLNKEATTTTSYEHTSNHEEEEESGSRISEEDLLRLLHAYGNATKAGAFLRQRWDWVGSFHFAWTIVSTIGYGATTPTTTAGQLLIIPYGFFGCAGGLLFFNLFLERIITFLTNSMKCYRVIRQKGRGSEIGVPGSTQSHGQSRECWNNERNATGTGRRSSQSSGCNAQRPEEWKPSVLWVLVCLFMMSAIIIFASAALYHEVEGWTYVESLYFAFVTYATIGFGDFVTFQQISYGDFEIVYRVVAFGVMVFGCCCIYSLLNVTSIVIKKFLNWIIKALDCRCCICCKCLNTRIRRSLSSRRRRTLRLNKYSGNAGRSSTLQVAVVRVTSGNESGHHCSIDMEDHDRRYSGENLVSLRSELSNKVSMAVMQKRLYETAQLNRVSHTIGMESDFSVRNVGPLAIVSEKFGDNTS